jgi:hypothetical protein
MSLHGLEKRFGITAVHKGFITSDQLIEAMTLQIREELDQHWHRPIGQILLELGYLESPQVEEVLSVLGLKTAFLRTLTENQDKCLPQDNHVNP